MDEDREVLIFAKILIVAFGVVTLFGGAWFISSRSVQVADSAIIHYEDFQEIYNSTQALNQKLCNLKAIPDTDPMFRDFSKAAQANGLRNNLTRWIEEYNAKSKMWNRALWKSKTLPYQLSTTDFNCY